MTLALYNLPVTEQLEPKASEHESATPVTDRTQRLRFHHSEAVPRAERKGHIRLCVRTPENSLGQTGGDSVPASVWKRQVPSLLTMLGRALGQPVALLGERR